MEKSHSIKPVVQFGVSYLKEPRTIPNQLAIQPAG